MLKKKIEKIVIGSNNKGKIKEIRDLIPKKYRIFTPSQFKLKSPVENGKSFKENSLEILERLLIWIFFLSALCSFLIKRS